MVSAFWLIIGLLVLAFLLYSLKEELEHSTELQILPYIIILLILAIIDQLIVLL